MPPLNKTPYQLHVERWGGGCGAGICSTARHVVLARGKVPCDVLFVGEAPGESEDALGSPFVGPAGKLLDRVVAKALDGIEYCSVCRAAGQYRMTVLEETTGKFFCAADHEGRGDPVTVAFTNLVGCIPRDGTKKAGEPDAEDIKKCKPRLEEMIRIARPRVVVAVGKLSVSWLAQGYRDSVKLPAGTKTVSVDHPAFILRANVAQRGLLLQKAEVVIGTAAEDL